MTSLALFLFPGGCFYECQDCVTRAELDDAVAAQVGETYTKEEVDAIVAASYSKEEVDALVADMYTQAEVDALVAQAVTDALAEADTRYQAAGSYLTTADVGEYCVTDEELVALGYSEALDELDVRLDEIEADYLTKSEGDGYYQPIGDYLTQVEADGYYQPIGDYLTQVEADGYYQPIGEYALATDLDTLDDSVVHLIATDITYSVASGEELRDTLATLDGYRIASGATVTIQLTGTTYTFTEPIVVGHPDGARISIVGDTTDSASVRLSFTGSSNGVVLAGGQSLGYLGGLTIEGDGEGTGLLVENGGSVFIGALAVTGWNQGVALLGNGTARAANGSASFSAAEGPPGQLDVSSNVAGLVAQYGGAADLSDLAANSDSKYGVLSQFGSVVSAGVTVINSARDTGAVAMLNSTIVLGDKSTINGTEDGSNLEVEYTSSIYARDLDSTLAGGHGAHVRMGSVLAAEGASFDSNTGDGTHVEFASSLECEDCTGTNNGGEGFFTQSLAAGDLVGATASGNVGSGVLTSWLSFGLFENGASYSNAYGLTLYGDSVEYAPDANLSSNTLTDVTGSPTVLSIGSAEVYATAYLAE